MVQTPYPMSGRVCTQFQLQVSWAVVPVPCTRSTVLRPSPTPGLHVTSDSTDGSVGGVLVDVVEDAVGGAVAGAVVEVVAAVAAAPVDSTRAAAATAPRMAWVRVDTRAPRRRSELRQSYLQ